MLLYYLLCHPYSGSKSTGGLAHSKTLARPNGPLEFPPGLGLRQSPVALTGPFPSSAKQGFKRAAKINATVGNCARPGALAATKTIKPAKRAATPSLSMNRLFYVRVCLGLKTPTGFRHLAQGWPDSKRAYPGYKSQFITHFFERSEASHASISGLWAQCAYKAREIHFSGREFPRIHDSRLEPLNHSEPNVFSLAPRRRSGEMAGALTSG
jgi:hypothetical protein